MKYVDEYRDADAINCVASAIKNKVTKNWKIMEVCGGQTNSIIKYGIADLLPKEIELIHGPGCPVCVTPLEAIDKAHKIAQIADIIFCSFGDMLRVPGSVSDLIQVKSQGADVRVVLSPLDAVDIAKNNPDKKIVFFAIGFETTAPADALAVYRAKEMGLTNFFILVSHVLVPPAIEAVMSSSDCLINGFLAAGHVCTIEGYQDYEKIAKSYNVPIVVTGFEPLDIIKGVYQCICQLEEGRVEVENEYSRIVKREGNIHAKEMVAKVFKVSAQKWRGIGEIPESGLELNNDYKEFDAAHHFKVENVKVNEPQECIAGDVLRGIKKPDECSVFGTKCIPEHPYGAPMVSTEGACSAYYRYKAK